MNNYVKEVHPNALIPNIKFFPGRTRPGGKLTGFLSVPLTFVDTNRMPFRAGSYRENVLDYGIESVLEFAQRAADEINDMVMAGKVQENIYKDGAVTPETREILGFYVG